MGVQSDLATVKYNLHHCPICGWRLVDDRFNDYIRRCAYHGAIFTIVIADGGYEVVVDLNAESHS